jgi:hypothetical protein
VFLKPMEPAIRKTLELIVGTTGPANASRQLPASPGEATPLTVVSTRR